MSEIHYQLAFCDQGISRSLTVPVDHDSLPRTDPVPEPLPQWLRLECLQCSHCPLASAPGAHCPAALSLLPLVQEFSGTLSHEAVDLTVTIDQRTISLHCTAQQAIGSLAGLLLATSACPHFSFLRPLARYHVPLAGLEETHLRAISAYLMGQFLRAQKGLAADFSCAGLVERYQLLDEVNRRLVERLRLATEQDSMVNAVVVLDMLARTFSLAMDDLPAELDRMYQSYLLLE